MSRERRRLTVLVVDDDRAVRRLLKHCLEQEGHEVFEASDGCEALAALQFRERPFDAMVSDVNMPGMNGVQLTISAKRQLPNLPILLVSSNFSEEAEELFGSMDGLHKLEKPFMLTEFLSMFQRLLGLKSLAGPCSPAMIEGA